MATHRFSATLAFGIVLTCFVPFSAPCLARQNPSPAAREPDLDEAGCPLLVLFPKLVTSIAVSCQRGNSVDVTMPLKPDAQGHGQEKSLRGDYEFREYQIQTDQREHAFENLTQLALMAGFTIKYAANPSTFTARKGDVWVLVSVGGEYYDVKMVRVKEEPWTPPFKTADQIAREMDSNGRVSFYGLEFSPDNQAITENDSKILTEILKYLETHPNQLINVESHKFSPRQSAEDDLEITRKRAGGVVDYLVAHGVAVGRLQAKGLGRTKPVTENDTAVEVQRNERIELATLSL
jgi:outer membrane protein OmpA-like peptidoglycan-associated protein